MTKSILSFAIILTIVLLLGHWGGGQIAVGWIVLGLVTGFVYGFWAAIVTVNDMMNEKEN